MVPAPKHLIPALPVGLQMPPEQHAGQRTSAGTFYMVEGPSDGALVVCVHGIGFGLHAFDLLAPALVAAGYRCCRFDFAGVGNTPARRGEYGLDAHVAQMQEVVQEVGGGAPVHMVAHSLGATVALAYALKHAPMLEGLVLLAPAGAMKPPAPCFAGVQRFVRACSGVCLPLLEKVLGGPPPPGDFILDGPHVTDKARAEALNAWLMAWAAADGPGRARPLVERMARMPVTTVARHVPAGSFAGRPLRALVCTGAADPTVQLRPADTAYYQALGFAALKLAPPHALGHCFHLQDPAPVHEAVLAFLNGTA